MKIVKRILLFLLIIIAAALITALFVSKDFAVEKEVTIAKPKQEVFDYIKYLKNQDNYSKWNNMDPGMKKTYSGTDGTVGFKYAWDSERDSVGKGEQEIAKITEGERVDFKLRFIEPMEIEHDAYLTTTAVDSANTKVSWGFTGKYPYPMNLMNLFMDMDKMVGGDLQTGLDNLKKVMESK